MKLLRAMIMALATLGAAWGGAGEAEYKLKAAFLVQFAKYVEWPSGSFDRAGSPIVIGVFGTDPFGRSIDEAAAPERIDGREVVVRRVKTPQEARQCHILFLPKDEAARPGAQGIAGPILTVGESPDFARRIGMIGFYLADRRVRFEINPDRARAEGLAISSRLLALARIVRGGGQK